MRCSKCKKSKDKRQFYKNPRSKRGLDYRCKACHLAIARQCPSRTPEVRKQRYQKDKEKIRNINLKYCFGIDLNEYNRMLEAQNFKCAICEKTKNENVGQYGKQLNFSVDHDHVTLRVRGLLCTKCNSVLGLANDSIKILERSITYLKNAL